MINILLTFSTFPVGKDDKPILNFQSLVIIYLVVHNKQFYVLPTQLYLCVLCGSHNKQTLFPYTALTDWFFKICIYIQS
jgi:hypothetical protein